MKKTDAIRLASPRRLIARIISMSEVLGLRLKNSQLSPSILARHLTDAVLWPSDFFKVRSSYKNAFGVPPNLVRPRTFNEKLQHSKLFRRKAHHVRFADKLAVRDFVAEKIGPKYLTNILWRGTDLREANQIQLPDRFVIKSNQGSGTNIIVEDVSGFDWDTAHKQTQNWLENDHSIYFAEWQYRWVKPMLLIEEYLEGENGEVPSDYKFFCFHGKVELLQVDSNRFKAHVRSFFDRDFNLLPVKLCYPRHDGTVMRPDNFEEMCRLAETLAANEPFVRVDFYDIGRPVFGEITLHPTAGLKKFDPPEWDYKLGALI